MNNKPSGIEDIFKVLSILALLLSAMSSSGPFPPLTTVTFLYASGGLLVVFLGLRIPFVNVFLQRGVSVAGIIIAVINVYYLQGIVMMTLFLVLAMFLIFMHMLGRIVFSFFRGFF